MIVIDCRSIKKLTVDKSPKHQLYDNNIFNEKPLFWAGCLSTQFDIQYVRAVIIK